MKRAMQLIGVIVCLLFYSTCYASEPIATEKPVISILYSDNTSNSGPSGKKEAKSRILGNTIDKFSSKYNIFLDDKHLQEIYASGMNDLTSSERGDIISFFKNDPTDYIVIIDILPHQTTSSFLYSQITPSLQLKIIDIKNNKYIYNGKLTYKSTWASMAGCYGELNKQIEAQLIKPFPL